MNQRELSCSYVGEYADTELGREGSGHVIGVFHHGWYLGNRTSVWLLHDQKHGEVPFGLGVTDFEQTFLYQKELEGAEAIWSEDRIQIPTAGLTLRRCRPVNHAPEKQVGLTALRTMCRTAWPILQERGRGELRYLLNIQEALLRGEVGAAPAEIDLFLRHAQRKIAALFAALHTADRDRLRESLEKLIGFGSGLTPSMDDWLTGFLYVLLRGQVCAHAKRQIENMVSTILHVIPGRTNRISEVYVTTAAKGKYFEELDRALHAENDADIEQLLAFGSSSGSDMMTGMIFAALYLESAGYIK